MIRLKISSFSGLQPEGRSVHRTAAKHSGSSCKSAALGVLASLGLLLAGCQSSASSDKPPLASIPTATPKAQVVAMPPPAEEGFWEKPEGVKGSPKIMISLEDQVAYFYIGKTLVGESPISSGKSSTRTPTGSYRVIQKEINHRSSAYGVFKSRRTGEIVDDDAEVNNEPTPKGCYFVGAKMPYFMRLSGGYGMHAGYLPGYAASHGCIRLPYSMAQKFYQHAPYGTPVIIRHDIN